jgi:5-formyltetrahydrofolate cyclo-ligase
MNKLALRKIARLKRAGLARALPDFAARIAGFDLALPPDALVAGYAPIASEADPTELMIALMRRGHSMALPRIVEADAPLEFRRWRENDELVQGAYGINEPMVSASLVVPSVLLVPLLAFDAQGFRLGYGGGYYDRTIAGLRASGPMLAIGIAFSEQEVDALPHEDFDQPLDAVVTETGVRKFG